MKNSAFQIYARLCTFYVFENVVGYSSECHKTKITGKTLEMWKWTSIVCNKLLTMAYAVFTKTIDYTKIFETQWIFQRKTCVRYLTIFLKINTCIWILGLIPITLSKIFIWKDTDEIKLPCLVYAERKFKTQKLRNKSLLCFVFINHITHTLYCNSGLSSLPLFTETYYWA